MPDEEADETKDEPIDPELNDIIEKSGPEIHKSSMVQDGSNLEAYIIKTKFDNVNFLTFNEL